MNPPKNEQGLIIPYEKLSVEALRGLLEEVVTRHGTDNGYIQATLEQNVAMVMEQLRRKEVVVVYDEITQTANIVPAKQLATPEAQAQRIFRGRSDGI
ncbi:MAG: YheU family protein [Desulfobacteraceae bacterium]|nr:YheU family protein [Desulfobacteraceae bacterium]